jgi:hypothetical protein
MYRKYSIERQFLVHFLLLAGVSLVTNFMLYIIACDAFMFYIMQSLAKQELRSISFELLCKYTFSCVQHHYEKMSWPEYSCSHDMCLNSKPKILIQRILLSLPKTCQLQTMRICLLP